jgi:hypothetical protein
MHNYPGPGMPPTAKGRDTTLGAVSYPYLAYEIQLMA